MKAQLLSAALAASLVSSLPLRAQTLVEYDTGADLISSLCDVHSVHPGSVCPAGTFPVPVRPPSGFPAGAVTANHPGRVVLMTDGVTDIVRITHPQEGCPGSGVIFGPLPLPGLPLYDPAVAPITGMAMDPGPQWLYLTDGFQITGHNPAAGMLLVAGSWPTPAFLTGLDFDSGFGNVVGVAANGDLHVFNAAGLVVGFVPWVAPVPAGVQATGVALDRCVVAGGGGPLPAAYYVAWTDGVVRDNAGVVVGGAGLFTQGLSYAGIPTRLPSPAGAVPLVARTDLYVRPGAPFSLLLCNAPGGAWVWGSLAAYAAPVLILGGESLWVPPAAPIWIPVPGAPPAMPMPPFAPGLTFYVQWAIPGGPFGFELSNALEVQVSFP